MAREAGRTSRGEWAIVDSNHGPPPCQIQQVRSRGCPLALVLGALRNARVPTYTVNKEAIRHAKELIDARQYVLRSRWQDRQPRAREQNTFLKTHS